MNKYFLFAVLLLASAMSARADTVTYGSRVAFESVLALSVTDNYEAPGYKPSPLTVLNDVVMSSVIGETQYRSTGIANHNVISSAYGLPNNHFYCAGCNGTFEMSFTQTSLGDATGIFGVGFDIYDNHGTSYGALPMRAEITFGDGSTNSFQLPELRYSSGSDYTFFGVSSTLRISSIAIVNSPNSSASFAIDNLTIGAPVPEPSTLGLGLISMAGLGAALRVNKRSKGRSA